MKIDSFKRALCPLLLKFNHNICPENKSPLKLKIEGLNTEITRLKDTLSLFNEIVAEKEKTLQDNLILIDKQFAQIREVEDENYRLSYSHPMEQYWNERRSYADIKYAGRYLPMSKVKKISIPVQLYVTPNDTDILKDIKTYGLNVKDPLKCNDDIVKIYRHTRTKPSNSYRYIYDEENLGVPEFWFFPFELRFAKKGDCDDWGNELASYLIAAGVPRFRVRCVVGNTWGGGGHHTVYVLGDDFKTWYHINSTTGIAYIRGKVLTEFPTSNDSKDSIGIKDVWFSYNDTHSWNEFETEFAEKEFKKEIKNIIINGGN